jgi:iron(III) transport system ATP-binding protein
MPEEVYLNPASRFVAEFVTQANFLPATRKGRVWLTEIGEIKIPTDELTRKNYSLTAQGDLMLRPEDISLIRDPNSGIVVRERQFLGREYYYGVSTASGKTLYARTDLNQAIAIGTRVSLSLNMASPKIFLSGDVEKPLSPISI